MNRKTILAFTLILIAVAGISFWAGGAFKSSSTPRDGGQEEQKPTTYYCSMHPHITVAPEAWARSAMRRAEDTPPHFISLTTRIAPARGGARAAAASRSSWTDSSRAMI